MKILGFEIRRARRREVADAFAFGSGTGSARRLMSREHPMLLSAVYRCVNLLSDTLAALPCEVMRLDNEGFRTKDNTHPAADLLGLEPGCDMTAFTFFRCMVSSMLLQGNAYAYIDRDMSGHIRELVFLHPSKVSVTWVVDAAGIRRKRYRVTGFADLVPPSDMLHVLNFSYDGVTGVSTLEHARQTLAISTQSEEHASGFFASGGQMSGVLNVEGVLNKQQRAQIYETWKERTDAGGVVVLQSNMKYQPISISPRDSQLLESRRFNVLEVCRFFGVSPIKNYELENTSYNTIEATQIEFLTDTLQPLIRRFEDELNRKIFTTTERADHEVRFDTAALLRTNKQAQGEYLRNMFYCGAYTTNEIRRENGMARIEGGDVPMVQVNMTGLANVATAHAGNQE